ncbi:MAG: hypothetical protein A4E19_13630 [Nitrospira sp. SG-bin1]|nr:MAG: hypothetical protein A4E19_13630 [Nitrospira sp. SG-bin1]
MMNQPLVSVVIPTYNRGYCLQRCLDSVLIQSYQNVEILLIDDGSEDGTGELVKRLYDGDIRIRYVYKNNKGVAAARNHGLRLAGGEFVALLDSDDIWKPWKLELQLAVMAHLPEVGMVWTDMEAIDATGNVCDPKYLRTMYHAYGWFPDSASLFSGSCALSSIVPKLSMLVGDVSVNFGNIFSPMIMGSLVHTSTVLIRKDRLARVRGFQERFRYAGEDYDFHLRICREGPVAFVDASSIQYQVGMEDQLTRPRYKAFVAVHSLKTIRPILNEERSRISLAPSLINDMLANSYAWLGETLCDRGKRRYARRYFYASLRYKPFRVRLYYLVVLSMITPPIVRRVKQMVRRLKGWQ